MERLLTDIRRLFVVLSGLAHITIPATGEDLWVSPGPDSMIIAADIIGYGHVTDYPSKQETVALQIPFKNGVAPPHHVLNHGFCRHSQKERSLVVQT